MAVTDGRPVAGAAGERVTMSVGAFLLRRLREAGAVLEYGPRGPQHRDNIQNRPAT
jgi:hypothetical protein